MKKHLVIFCIPIASMGHINASVRLCEGLQKEGHRIVFGVERSWQGKFLKYGFEEEVYDEREVKEGEVDGKFWSDFLNEFSPLLRTDLAAFDVHSCKTMIKFIQYSNKRVRQILETVKPDFIIQDNYFAYPCIVNSGIPYAVLWSANPLIAINSSNLPPIETGEPIDDTSNWEVLREKRNNNLQDTWQHFNKWMMEQGAPELKPIRFQYDVNCYNICMYPKALFEDYAKRVQLDDKWMLLEHAIKYTPTDFHLPEQFVKRPGNLVYVAMGSFATGDVALMKDLVNILSKSKHKFIFSLGANHDKYEIADNMWGQSVVPQLEVLKICDLFITHGGNNSLIESLYFGVPMIVMPLFSDQHSNAQRVVEMKLGSKLSTFKVTEEELLSEIDALLNDSELRNRLSHISKQLQKSDSLNEVVHRIEKIASSKK